MQQKLLRDTLRSKRKISCNRFFKEIIWLRDDDTKGERVLEWKDKFLEECTWIRVYNKNKESCGGW